MQRPALGIVALGIVALGIVALCWWLTLARTMVISFLLFILCYPWRVTPPRTPHRKIVNHTVLSKGLNYLAPPVSNVEPPKVTLTSFIQSVHGMFEHKIDCIVHYYEILQYQMMMIAICLLLLICLEC